MKPYVNSSSAWKRAVQEIQQLADCLIAYKQHLDKKAVEEAHNRGLDHPVCTIDRHATVEHKRSTPFAIQSKFLSLEKDVKAAGVYNPVLFDETKHLETPFQSSIQRFRFFAQLQLSVPVDIIKFCPGGSIVTTVCITEVPSHRTEPEMLTQGARMVQRMRPHLKECHTRAQKRAFKEKLDNIARIQPSVVDFIFAELTLDAATASHPDMQQRLRSIFLGEQGLLADLRYLNTGRPTERYDLFFEKLAELVEEVTAADDRRHSTAHLAQWISLSGMVKQAADRCPQGTPIPSKSLVRLQFTPSNPYTCTALTFTSRIAVQHKVQRRQLRAQHPDDHYCAALFKYLKNKAVEMREDAVMFCCDDKAKIPVGEPGQPVSTGVRGRRSIAPVSSTLAALDHDMTKASLTPSVVLMCSIPEVAEKSFVRGKVTTVVNDSVFQTASPFRHTAVLKKVIEQLEELPKVVMKYTDGGTDQCNTLESVKCASICLFKEFDLDMLIAARCAPGHSFANPAERVMSVLNYGLQNCATERHVVDEATDAMLKKCNSMADLRAMAIKKPELQGKWRESVEPVQALVRNRFMRLKLTDEPISILDPATEEEITTIKRHLPELFPELDLSKLQKVHTRKVQSYNSWKEKHCRETLYSFQIRKCQDQSCCLPPQLPHEQLTWLPDPMLDAGGEHFKPYNVVKHEETTEKDRPSLKLKKPSSKPNAVVSQVTQPSTSGQEGTDTQEDTTVTPPSTGAQRDDSAAPPNTSAHEQNSVPLENEPTVSFSAQNARATV